MYAQTKKAFAAYDAAWAKIQKDPEQFDLAAMRALESSIGLAFHADTSTTNRLADCEDMGRHEGERELLREIISKV